MTWMPALGRLEEGRAPGLTERSRARTLAYIGGIRDDQRSAPGSPPQPARE